MEMRWNKDGDKTEMRRRRDTDATHTRHWQIQTKMRHSETKQRQDKTG